MSRIGSGWDAHKPRGKQICHVVNIPYEKGLLGHSDAGCAALHIRIHFCRAAASDTRDIFPDTDPA